MSPPLMAIAWLGTVIGAALLLSDAPWFRRTRLLDRLSPYSPRGRAAAGADATESLGRMLVPGLERWAERMSRVLGVRADLATRLDRAGLDLSPSEFRVRQATRSLLALLATAAAVMVLRPPAVLALTALAAAPLLTFLAEEHRVGAAVDRRRDSVAAELPVVAEQLGLLLSAGYSLPSALGRLAARSDGAIARDLAGVTRRIRQGLSASDALGEWAADADLEPIERLVAVLRLHDDAGDLGALIAEEARSIRAAAHRDLLEVIERRSQLVWVPVTVATLVPGLLFLAVPFMSAMAQVSGGG